MRNVRYLIGSWVCWFSRRHDWDEGFSTGRYANTHRFRTCKRCSARWDSIRLPLQEAQTP
jgi:hypothetical protein